MHSLHLIGRGPTVSQKWLQGGRNRYEQGKDVVQRNMVGGLDAVRAVLAAAGVTYADLVLVVKPSLVELGPGGVENPAAEPPPHGGQICLVGYRQGL